MTLRSRILLEAAGLVVLLVLSFFAYGWMMHVYLGLQLHGVVMLLAPTAFVLAICAVYGFYVGLERRFGAASQVPVGTLMAEALGLVGYSLLLLLFVGGALYSYWRGAKGVALLFAVPAALTLVILWRTLQRRLDRQLSASQGEGGYRLIDKSFEYRFRNAVFTFLLILTWTCALLLIAVGSLENGVALVLVGLIASPWLIKKIREDRRRSRREG